MVFNNQHKFALLTIFFICFFGLNTLEAQVNIQLQVYAVEADIGDCDGFLGGDSDPAWWFNGGNVPQFDCNFHETTCNGCSQNINMTIIDETYDCPTDLPTSLSYNFHGCENDGLGCLAGLVTTNCDGNGVDVGENIQFQNSGDNLVFQGTTYDFNANPNIDFGQVCYTDNSGGCPGQWCYSMRIVKTGSFLSTNNDRACDAIALGTTTLGGTLGDENNAIYQNFCGTPDTEAVTDQGVWFSFQTGNEVGTQLTIEIEPEGGWVPLVGDLDVEAYLFQEQGSCNSLVEVADANGIVSLVRFDGTISYACPRPNTTYYILVDGEANVLDLFGLASEDGYFGIAIYDDGVSQAADFICDAEYLGEPSPGNSVTTDLNTQSNICATSTNDPNPGFNWDIGNGVWYQFTAPPSGSVNIDIDSDASVLNILEQYDLDVYVAVYTTLDDVCDPTFSTNDLEFVDEQHSLFSPCGLEPPGEDDAFDESLDVYCLEPGQSYWIFIDGAENLLLALPTPTNGDAGYFSITVSDLERPPAPNNLLCDAIALDGGVQLAPGQSVTLNNQSNRCANNFYEPYDIVGTCNETPPFTNEQGVWYSFVAPVSGAVDIWARNLPTGDLCLLLPQYVDAIHLELSVYYIPGGPDCTNLPPQDDFQLICAESEEIDDLILGGIGPLDAVNDEHMFVECLIPGETYYILVDGLGLGGIAPDFLEGMFNIELEALDQPTPTGNDTPCEAVDLGPLNGTDPTLYNNYCATADPSDPLISGTLGVVNPDHYQSVWFTFTAPATGSVIVEGINSGNDDIALQIGVYQSSDGTCNGDMLELNSDFDPLPLGEEVPEIYCLVPGETYYILVDGYDEPLFTDFLVEGDFQISVTTSNSTITQANDEICNATVFPGSPFTDGPQELLDEHNLCAQDFGDPNPSCFDTNHTVWYAFDTPAGGTGYAVDITILSLENIFNPPYNSIMDPEITVFESDNDACDGNLAEISCAYDIFDPEIQFPDVGLAQSISVQCLEPNSTYYIMVDGSELNLQGFFDISIQESVVTNPSALNDACVQAFDLGTVPQGGSIDDGVDYSNYCALTDVGEAVPSEFTIDQTVWFTFTAPNDGVNDLSNVTINLLSDPAILGDPIDLQVAVYESDSDCSGTFTEINSSYDPLTYNETLGLLCLTPGQEYYIQIDGANSNDGFEGLFQIEIVDDGGSTSAPNDDICNAIALGTIPNGGTIDPGTVFTNLCATVEANEPDPNFSPTDSIVQTVWYTFMPSISGNVVIDAFSHISNSVDLQLAVYYSADNSCDPDQMVPVGTAWNTGLLDETLEIPCLDPSITYYLQVEGSSTLLATQAGNFTLEITDDGGSFAAPNNNDICNAEDFGTIAGTESMNSQTNECANVQLDEPGIFEYAQNTVWYEFVAPLSGQVAIEVDPLNSSTLVPEIHLFLGNAASCQFSDLSLSASEIFPAGSPSYTMQASCIIPGETYFVQVDGQAGIGATGQFNIHITDTSPNYAAIEPANNECFNAIDLFVQAESCYVGDGTWDLGNYGQPTVSIDNAYTQSCNPNGNCGDTWYCFTLPPTGTVLIEGLDDSGGPINDDSDLTVIAYTGDCNGLIPLDCEAGGSAANISYEVEAEPGTKVYLQVFDGGGDDFNESFGLCISEQCGADNCDFAITMEADSVYCWNTASATGENVAAGDLGYLECGDGSNPEHSIYFSFTSGCNGGSATVSLLNVSYADGDVNYIPCENFLNFQENALDGFTFTVFADSTPCDGQEDALVHCEVFNGCDHNPNNNDFSFTFENLNANTDYIIQIDGGAINLQGDEVGGNVQGEIMIEVEPVPEIDSMVVVDSIVCFGGTGTVTAIINPESYPNLFNWDNISFDSIYTNVSPGWHYLTVTGSNGCEETDSIFLPEPPELFVSIALDNPIACNGGTTSATATGTGGVPDYTYVWSTIPEQTTATAIDLPAGTHTVTITDSSLCTNTEEITIVDPVPIAPSVVIEQNVSCKGGSDGSATASATDGVIAIDYAYEWSTIPPQSNATAIDLAAGIYTVTITDDNSCTTTIDVTITEPDTIIPTITVLQEVLCNGGNDGSATVSATGGTVAGDYTYEWSTNPSQTTNTATDLVVGDYTVTVTDDNGCSVTAEVTLIEPIALVPAVMVNQDVTCFGGNNGSATASATGGMVAGDYGYEWSTTPTQTTATATGLMAGIHTVTITDDNNCDTTITVTINEPAEIMPVATVVQDADCNGESTGIVTVTATGGTVAGDYTYLWDSNPAQTTATATGLLAGTYNVTVTDDSLCTAITQIIVGEPSIIEPITSVVQHVSCFEGNDGSAMVTATGGTTTAGDYTYEWNTTPIQTTATATNLEEGTYIVTVSDNNSCTATAEIDITEPTGIITVVLGQDVFCFGDSTGQATVAANGGTEAGDYDFLWSDDLGQMTDNATGLPANDYTVTITDDNGCTATDEVTISEPSPVIPTIVMIQNVSCNGGSDGEATVAATGGTESNDYVYAWDSSPIQNGITATNLSAGDYIVVVTDDNLCTATISVTITEPLGMIATATEIQPQTNCNNPDGIAEVTVVNGLAPYTYEWETVPSQTTMTATDLTSGTYTVTVYDASLCTTTATVFVDADTSTIANETLTPVSCFGGSDGQIELNPIGVGPFTYTWSLGTGNPNAGLAAGDYTVTIVNANGCSHIDTFTLIEASEIQIAATDIMNTSCSDDMDGAITIEVTGGTGNYSYTWDGDAIGQDETATGLSPNTYNVTVTDDNNCTQVATFDVISPLPLITNLDSTNPANCFACDGVANVSVTGGTMPYGYLWSNGNITASPDDLCSGTNTVTVTDMNGCLSVFEVNIDTISTLLLDQIISIETSCNGSCDGEATAQASNGAEPYNYQWDVAAGNQQGQTATGLCVGIYEVSVTDMNGCLEIGTVEISEPEPLELFISPIDVSCYDGVDGGIQIDSVQGGYPPYNFAVDNNAGFSPDTIFNNLGTGNYTVYVQDANLCVESEEVFVNEPPELLVTAYPLDTLIALGEEVGLLVIPNQANTSFDWSPMDSLDCANCNDPIVSPTATTLYTVVVTDTLNGCKTSVDLLVRVDKERNIFIPNAFTPNQDGYNDFVGIYADGGVRNIRSFRIYDRWGELVFENQNFQPNDPTDGWDGYMNGKLMNTGVFVYAAEIEFVDGAVKIYKGDITLVR